MTFNAKAFDRFLSKNSMRPNWIQMHPDVWSGFWYVKRHSQFWGKILRRTGRLVKSRRIYWLGLPIVCAKGFKEIIDENVEVEDIYDEIGHTFILRFKD